MAASAGSACHSGEVSVSHVLQAMGVPIYDERDSAAIMITVTGAIFSLMNPAQGSGQVQPEIADLQQLEAICRTLAEIEGVQAVLSGLNAVEERVRLNQIDCVPADLGDDL